MLVLTLHRRGSLVGDQFCAVLFVFSNSFPKRVLQTILAPKPVCFALLSSLYLPVAERTALLSLSILLLLVLFLKTGQKSFTLFCIHSLLLYSTSFVLSNSETRRISFVSPFEVLCSASPSSTLKCFMFSVFCFYLFFYLLNSFWSNFLHS